MCFIFLLLIVSIEIISDWIVKKVHAIRKKKKLFLKISFPFYIRLHPLNVNGVK